MAYRIHKSRDRQNAMALIAMCLLAVGGCATYQYGTVDTVSVSVTGKESIAGEPHLYLIFTETETFQCSDALFHGKFDSSDMYSHLEPGEYQFTVYGWRVPFLSMYRNIVEVQ